MKTRIRRVAGRARRAAKIQRLKIGRKTSRMKRSALRKLGLAPSVYGVNLIGYIRAEMGLGQAARGMASAMDSASVPFSIINFEAGNPSAHTNRDWSHKEVEQSDFDVTLLCVNPDNLKSLRAKLPHSLLNDHYLIANWFWELPQLPDEWVGELSLVNEVWAASEFIRDAVTHRSALPVVVIPPVIRATPVSKLERKFFGLPERQFLFLCVCDAMSILERKNPLGAVRAFKRAFPISDSRVGLVLKFNNSARRSAELEKVLEEVRGSDNIYVIDRVFSRGEMNSFLETVDVVVSLHRSEGFGLVPAESMSLGKPVILTNWSGNTDYMTSENSIGIDYELVRLGKDFGPYKSDQIWAEPDVDQAAHWMKRLLDEPALGEKIGRCARASIQEQFSPKAVGELIKQRLDYIQGRI